MGRLLLISWNWDEGESEFKMKSEKWFYFNIQQAHVWSMFRRMSLNNMPCHTHDGKCFFLFHSFSSHFAFQLCHFTSIDVDWSWRLKAEKLTFVIAVECFETLIKWWNGKHKFKAWYLKEHELIMLGSHWKSRRNIFLYLILLEFVLNFMGIICSNQCQV